MKKLLLDENLPRQLKARFSTEFDVTTVPDIGWQAKKNGELLASMESEAIRYLLTADQNIKYQQNLENYSVVVVILISHDIRLDALTPYVAEIESVILNAGDESKLIEVDLKQRK
jgi:hypothetical protein